MEDSERTHVFVNVMFPATSKAARMGGFTLIELLVVIAIIGLLASVVLSAVNTVRLKAREVKRVADMHEVEQALQLYFVDHNGAYPPNPANNAPGLTCQSPTPNGTTYGQCLSSEAQYLVSGSHQYMPSIPLDPTHGDTTQGYTYAGCGQYYVLLYLSEVANKWCVPQNLPALPPTGQTCGWVTVGGAPVESCSTNTGTGHCWITWC